jgi:hypothetical protein
MGASTNGAAGGTVPGLTFDPGFAPNYWLGINIGNPYILFLDYAQLWPGGTNASGIATNGYFVGSNIVATASTLQPSAHTLQTGLSWQCTVNNSTHTNGVSGGSDSGCVTNTTNPAVGPLQSQSALLVTNGVEIAIPLAALGSPTGQIAVCAFIGGGSGGYMSNQILGPIDPTGTTNSYCGWGNLGNSGSGSGSVQNVNFGKLPGTHYFLVGPEMRVTSVTRAVSGGTTNVSVTFLPENNTNLLYQLQRTFAPLATNSTWANVGGLSIGGPAPITLTDTHATNKVGTVGGILYRVLQEPNGCP